MISSNEIKKGDIYYAVLDPIIGSEQSGTRPVVIIQNNKGNKYSPTVLVAPITSKVNLKTNLPTHITFKAFGKIKNDSIILLEQVRVLDKKRLKSYLCRLPIKQIQLINKALIKSFDISKDDYIEIGGDDNE